MMTENEFEQHWWSLDSCDKSINKDFESLRINSSSESGKDENIVISRGNPAVKKTLPSNDTKRKVSSTKRSKTSSFVLPFLKDAECNLELSKSSGYNSSYSPPKDFSAYNYSSELQNDQIQTQPCLPRTGILGNTSPYTASLFNDSKKRQLKDLLKLRLFSRKGASDGNEQQVIFEFGDTNLIKSCRTGQVSGVQVVLNQLVKDNKLALIDQQNAADETPLSIATYQMNEVMIRLLMKYYATPNLLLTMNNNVLQLAAAMTNDVDRRTLSYLISSIRYYNPGCLLDALTNKNIFNEDVSGILKRYRDRVIDDIVQYNCLQNLIEWIQYLTNYHI